MAKPRETSLSTEQFRTQLRSELTKICADLGKSYDNNQHRGYGFEIWVADLLLKLNDIEGDGADFVYASNDLKIDIAFEDEETKTLRLAQTKCESIPSNPNIEDDAVTGFFNRHDVFRNQTEWVRTHASDQLHDLICDYSKRIDEGWTINFYFVSTGTASDRLKGLVASLDELLKKKSPTVNFAILDFYGLKERYLSSRSVDAPISEHVDIQFPQEYLIFKETPH